MSDLISRIEATDWCSESGAWHLAERIRMYWADRGQAVRIDIKAVSYQTKGSPLRSIHCVRSDMIGGNPR